MARIFVYDGREHPDPDPNLTVEQVKASLADFYGEIANAGVSETQRGDDTIYQFQRRVGTKGITSPSHASDAGAMTNQTFMDILASVPPARLALLEIVTELTGPDGALDLNAAALRADEIDRATIELSGYCDGTTKLCKDLQWHLNQYQV